MAKSLPVSDYKEQKDRPQYTPSKEDALKLARIEKDFQDMIRARAVIDKEWKYYQTMMDAIPKFYGDDRSSSTVPLATAVIELFVAKASKIQTEFIIKEDNSKYKKAARIRQNVWDYDWRTNKRRKEIIDNEYTTAGFGRSVLRTGFEIEKIKQFELEEVKEDGEMIWKENIITDEKIILENIDPRNFYMDNNATRGIETAKKCMVRKRMGYDEFLDLENNKLYKNIEYVRPKGYTANYMPFTTREEASKQGKFVELREYWNLKDDVYCVWANGIIIREHHIMSTVKGRKVLPFTTRVLSKKIGRYDTGRGFCEALIRFNSELNDLREMLMDSVRKSNSPTIAIGNGLTFNGRKFSFDNEILEFTGDINNMQQISGTPPNQAIFEYMEKLFEQIAVFVGIDIKNILGDPQQTAYQTNVQQESSQERMNVWLTNRDMAFERMADQHMENLVRFFPREIAEGITPEIEIKDYEVQEEADENGEMKQSIVWKKGSSGLLAITPELMQGETYIDVYTNVSRPVSDIANRQSKLEFAQSIGEIANGYMLATQAGVDMSFIPFDTVVKELADEYNMESIIGEDVDMKALQTQGADFIDGLSGMMLWQQGGQPMEWEEQAPEQQIQWQEAPSTPSLVPQI